MACLEDKQHNVNIDQSRTDMGNFPKRRVRGRPTMYLPPHLLAPRTFVGLVVTMATWDGFVLLIHSLAVVLGEVEGWEFWFDR